MIEQVVRGYRVLKNRRGMVVRFGKLGIQGRETETRTYYPVGVSLPDWDMLAMPRIGHFRVSFVQWQWGILDDEKKRCGGRAAALLEGRRVV